MGRIVVGVDGSAPSLEALAWAAAEAGRRGSRLLAVLVHPDPIAVRAVAAAPMPTWSAELETAAHEHAEAILRDALTRTFPSGDPPALEVAVLEGDPATRLIALSHDAELVVVGSRGHGAISSVLMGSVSRTVASRSCCPVVIVPPAAVAPAAIRGAREATER